MGKRVQLVVCVDDTDDITKETSTGQVAEEICVCAQALGGVIELGITRHQLLLDERVAYTSHNSAMAFGASVDAEQIDTFWAQAQEVVLRMMSAAADPGLCLVVLPADGYQDDAMRQLIAFGRQAKTQVITRDEAYRLAETLPGVRLVGLAGTCDGVIGALAGAGLRVSGSEGRFRGSWDLQRMCAEGAVVFGSGRGKGGGKGDGSGGGKGHGGKHHANRTPGQVSAGRLRDVLDACVKGHCDILDAAGVPVPDDTVIQVEGQAKPVLFGGKLVIVVDGSQGVIRPLDHTQLEELHGGFADFDRTCPLFQPDNDIEECCSLDVTAPVCPNCLYRRWTSGGFVCCRPPVAPEELPC